MRNEILVVLGLMVMNGLFAGAEIAVLSVRRTRLTELVDEGARGARAVLWLRQQPERFLATVQVGLTVVGTTAAAFGGERLASDVAARLAQIPLLGPWAHSLGLVVVIAAISYLEIVIGELVPKSLALRSADRYALWAGPPLRRMATLVKPMVWLLTASSNAVLGLFGDKTSFSEARLSPEEIRELVEEAGRVGSIDAKTTEIASRALDLRELRAVDVLVPLGSVVALPRDATAAQVRDALARSHHERFPVYEGSAENFVGYVTVTELLAAALDAPPRPLASVVRPVRFVPETAMATNLLRELQTARAPLAMVVDENGTVTGLVTLEDLLEEVVGEILSEHDAAPTTIALDDDGTVVLPAQVPIRDVNRALGLELPEPDGFTTLAGLCIEQAGRIPATGQRLALSDGSALEVLDASPRKVRLVRLHPAKPDAEAPDALEG